MGKYVLAAVLVSSLLTLFLLPVRKGLRRFVGSIGVYALWLFVAISLLLPFPQMVYKAVAGRELFQQQSKFSVMNLVDLAQKNQKAVDNKSENEYNSVKKTSLSTGETAQNKLSQQGDIIDESSRTDPARLKEEEVQTWKDYVKTYGLYEIWLLGFCFLRSDSLCRKENSENICWRKEAVYLYKVQLKKAADGHVMEYRWKEARFCFVRVE